MPDKWSNQYNVPTDHSKGILGTELVDGEWQPKEGYRLLARFPGDKAYGPVPCEVPKCKDPRSHSTDGHRILDKACDACGAVIGEDCSRFCEFY